MTPFKFDLLQCSSPEFVSFWERFYQAGKYSDSVYEINLNRGKDLREGNIKPLLEWKNGRPLSNRKQQIVRRTVEHLSDLNDFRRPAQVTSTQQQRFWEVVSKIVMSGVVWRVFLAHVARPDDYPILDQHVLRSFHYLEHGKLLRSIKPSLEDYLLYVEFFRNLCQRNNTSQRQVDKALMAFGQFLNSQFFSEEMVFGL